MHPRWSLVVAAAALVLLTYALLIEGWRRVLAELGGRLTLPRAAVIWFGSNLARYIPLSGWQMAVMTVMAKREAVPVSVSAGASLLLTIVNIVTGLGVFVAASAMTPTIRISALWFVGVGVLGLAVAPLLLPHLGRIASRLTGREITMPRIGLVPLLIAVVSTTVAWIAYGFAFWVLARGVLPGDVRSFSGCVALYTGSYLAGVLAFVPPAGLGAAEYTMTVLAPQLGVFSAAEAALLAVIVRVGRTLLEILPGVIALAIAAVVDGKRPELRAE